MGIDESWEFISQDTTTHGVNYLTNFFANYPEYQEYYPKLRGKSAEELREDPAMIAQVNVAMKLIGRCVASRNDRSALSGVLRPMARSHVARGISSSFCQDYFGNYKDYLDKVGIPSDGWDEAIGTFMEVLTEEFHKVGGI